MFDETNLEDGTSLSELETRSIDLAVRVAEFLGLPRSMGELYGLVFISQHPVNTDQLIERLHVSRGSASQGLAALKRIGAVRSQYLSGDRREYFVAENNLNYLLQGFLKERIEPALSDLANRLATLEEEVGQSGNQHYLERLEKVKSWRNKIEHHLPALVKALSS